MMPREPEEPVEERQGDAAVAGDLEQALDREKKRAESYLASWQRTQADFINFKRRCEQERAEAGDSANIRLILNILPIIDDLESAFAAIPSELAEVGWIDGMKLIGRKLSATLESTGLSPVEAIGKPFDPRFHEAIAQGPGEEGLVIQELQKGYKFRDKVIRPSRVVVGNGDQAGGKEEE